MMVMNTDGDIAKKDEVRSSQDLDDEPVSSRAKVSSNAVVKQGIWYVVAGGSSALLELVLFQLQFAGLGLPVAVANPIAVIVATALNFVINRSVTFKSTSNPIRSLVLYCVLFICNLAFSTITIGLLVNMGAHSLIAKLATQCCIVLWNFVLYRKVIFI